MKTRLHKLLRCLRVPYYRRNLLRHGVAASIEHESLLRALTLSVVVDIGANRGQFALAVRHCIPAARVYSFEPLRRPADRFAAVFEDAASQVVLSRAAISNRRGTEKIHVSRRDDSSSLLPIGRKQLEVYPGTEEVGTESVQVAPLADFIRPDDIAGDAMLKLDVQGYELIALDGCRSLLHRFKYVYVECSFLELYEGQPLAGEVLAWLAAHDLNLSAIYNVQYHRQGFPIQADFLFKRKRKPLRTDQMPVAA